MTPAKARSCSGCGGVLASVTRQRPQTNPVVRLLNSEPRFIQLPPFEWRLSELSSKR
jgi:hypothetical protein